MRFSIRDRVNGRDVIVETTGAVNLASLKQLDKGRAVVYTPHHGSDHEFGIIKSWNHSFVFVRFHSGDTAAACSAEQLQFIREVELPCERDTDGDGDCHVCARHGGCVAYHAKQVTS